MRKTLILSGWVLLLMMTVSLFAANIYAFVIDRESEVLALGFSTALGFIFGSFPTMVRDFMKPDETPPADAPSPPIDLARLRNETQPGGK